MSHLILVVRFAFKSVKYALVDLEGRLVLAHGKAHGIGQPTGEAIHTVENNSFHTELTEPTYETAFAACLKLIRAHGDPRIDAVAHRVIHGAEQFTDTVLIDQAVIAGVEALASFAPEHNPDAARGMRIVGDALPDVPQAAVFDTAFFSDLPPAAATYALPVALTKELRIRKWGFHGTTHAYVTERVSLLLGEDNLRQVVCYLGKGCSISAVSAGLPVDVSTGLTTLEGLPMRTRSGSIDPGIHSYVLDRTGMSLAEFDRILNEESGLYGLTGLTDMRAIWKAADDGDEGATLAIDLLVHRIVSYIAAYHGILGGAQAISFTGVIGENDHRLRAAVCQRLECLGVDIDPEVNAHTDMDTRSRIISKAGSDIVVLMVRQREALAMAQETAQLLGWRARP